MSFEAAPHSTPGSSLLSRLEKRVDRRPHVGLSPEFYARFGLADPWSDLDFADMDSAQASSLFSFVSSKPYHNRMRRLALSRWWREHREKAFADRRPGRRTAARKRFPGETPKRGLFGWGYAIDMGSMALPEPLLAQPDEDLEEEEGAPVRRGFRGPTAIPVDSPWFTTPWTGAKTAERRERPIIVQAAAEAGDPRRQERARPTDRVGERLRATAGAQDPVIQALIDAAPRLDRRGQRRLQQVLQRTETIDQTTRVVEIRRVLRQLTSARIVRTVFEDVAPDTAARPSQIARGRSASAPKSRGLRPVMWGAPSMQAVQPALPPEPEVEVTPTRAPAAAHAATRSRKRGPAWLSHKVAPQSARTISSSPVRRSGPSRAVRTASGEYRKASVRRTPGSQLNQTGAVRTTSGEWVSAATARTAASEFTGARSGTTAAGSFTGARRGQADGSDFVGARSGVTSATEFAGARSAQTAARAFEGATTATTAATAWAAARIASPNAGSFTGASSHLTERSEFFGARATRTDSGTFVGASRHQTDSGEFAGTRSGASRWAAERLATTGRPGTSGGRPSLLPRLAPRVAPDGTVVVHVDSPEEAEALATEIRRELPKSDVRVSQSPWLNTDYTGASVAEKPHRSQAEIAADRAVQAPAIGQAAQSALARWSPRERALTAAAAPRARRSLRGPLSHARGTPVADAEVLQPGVDWEGAPSGTTPSGEWRGSESFRTSAGQWQGAASAQTGSGAWTGASSTTTGSSDFQGARSGRTAAGRWQGAASGTSASGSFLGARLGFGRPLDWMGARTAFGQDSGAYRGAYSTRTGGSEFRGAGAWTTPGAAFRGARTGFRGYASSPDMAVPQHQPTFDTLGDLSAGYQPMAGTPGWAERMAKPHRLRASGELIRSLADARSAEQVVQIIVNRGQELRNAKLPKPVIQVIEQIQAQTADSDPGGRGVPRVSSGSGGSPTRASRGRSHGVRSTTRVLSGWTGLPRGSAATKVDGLGLDKVSKLAKKLRGLIHLAEGGRESDALRQAKLAHAERPQEALEKGGDVSNSESAAKQSVDIEALGREVLEVVNRELEMRQERRQEDNDVNIWW